MPNVVGLGGLVRRIQRQPVRHPWPDVEVDREPWAAGRGGDRGPGVEHELEAPHRPGHGQLAQAAGEGPAELVRRVGGADGHEVDVALIAVRAGREGAVSDALHHEPLVSGPEELAVCS